MILTYLELGYCTYITRLIVSAVIVVIGIGTIAAITVTVMAIIVSIRIDFQFTELGCDDVVLVLIVRSLLLFDLIGRKDLLFFTFA